MQEPDFEELIDNINDDLREQLIEGIEQVGGGSIVKFYAPRIEAELDDELKSRDEMRFDNPKDSFAVRIDDYVCPKCFCYLLQIPKSSVKQDAYYKCVACGWCHGK